MQSVYLFSFGLLYLGLLDSCIDLFIFSWFTVIVHGPFILTFTLHNSLQVLGMPLAFASVKLTAHVKHVLAFFDISFCYYL